MIPAWKERQIRLTGEPLNCLTHAHAIDLLDRVHRRIDSVRYQLWSSLKEVEQMKVRLQMGNPHLPVSGRRRRPKSKTNAQHPAGLFSQEESKDAIVSQ